MTDLAKTLGAGRLVAHFQPIVDMETRLPVGAESLARWQRPDGTVLAPNEFLPVIEDAGAMSALTAEMLCLALDGVRAWRRTGRSCFVSLNVTAEDLQRRAFFREVRSALERRGLDETALALELSERSALEDEAQVRRTLAKLRECGVRIGLDDFGTGYSSLERLADLPLTGVKIDKTFVGSMTADETRAAIVETIVALAHRLGLTVVAEGVEDEATWRALREVGADRAQGFLHARPTKQEDVVRLLEDLSAVSRL